MPVTPSYPGVDIEELPSGVRTITGVATSITAFIGRAPRGPVSEPTTISNFADFERTFGGLAVDYPLTYAVRDFFGNSGSQAIIVRLFEPPAGDGIARLKVNGLKLQATSPGAWGNNLEASVGVEDINKEVAARYGLAAEELFTLTVIERAPGGPDAWVERHRHLSIEEGPRRVDRVLEEASQLVRVQRKNDGKPDLPGDVPAPTRGAAASGGADSAALDAAAYSGSPDDQTGLYALEKVGLFNLLCIPADSRGGDTPPEVYQAAMHYCAERRAMLIVDSPASWSANREKAVSRAMAGLPQLGLSGTAARNAALYFPRVIQADPLREGKLDTFVPCGLVAGVMARTDVTHGVWKAPAGMEAVLIGVPALEVNLTDKENGLLNPLGINCLRNFPIVGRVVWGARTLRGADQLADAYKYVPVRRLALYIEESLDRGLKWVVFEPNDEPLWAQIRLHVGAFMYNLFHQGAFQGTTPSKAFFVKCDAETTTQNDIVRGYVNILVGFAALKPAEFLLIKIQKRAGQTEA